MANKPWDGPWEDGDQFNADHVNGIVNRIKENQAYLGRTVRYDDQYANFTDQERLRARDNIDAVGKDAALIYYDGSKTLDLNEDQKKYVRTTIGAGTGDINAENIVSAYNESSTYQLDDLISYQGKIYKCINNINNTAGEWDSTYWEETTVAEQFQDFKDSIQATVNTYTFDTTVDLLSLLGTRGVRKNGYRTVGGTEKRERVEYTTVNAEGYSIFVYRFNTPIKFYLADNLASSYENFYQVRISSAPANATQLLKVPEFEDYTNGIKLKYGYSGYLYTTIGDNDLDVTDKAYKLPSNANDALTINSDQFLSVCVKTALVNQYGLKLNIVSPNSLALDYLTRDETLFNDTLSNAISTAISSVSNQLIVEIVSATKISILVPINNTSNYWEYILERITSSTNATENYNGWMINSIGWRETLAATSTTAFSKFSNMFLGLKTTQQTTEMQVGLLKNLIISDGAILIDNFRTIDNIHNNISSNYVGAVYKCNEFKLIQRFPLSFTPSDTTTALQFGNYYEMITISTQGVQDQHKIKWNSFSTESPLTGLAVTSNSGIFQCYLDYNNSDIIFTNNNFAYNTMDNNLAPRKGNLLIYEHVGTGDSMEVYLDTDLPIYLYSTKTESVLTDPICNLFATVATSATSSDYSVTSNSVWEWTNNIKFNHNSSNFEPVGSVTTGE